MSPTFTFAETLKGFRRRADLTQEDLALAVRRGRTTISAWERGLNLPENRDVVIDLASALSMSPVETDQLLTAAGYAILEGSSPAHGTPSANNEEARVRRLFIDETEGLTRAAPLIPFQAPPLPTHFVARPDVTAVMQAQLLGHTEIHDSKTSRAPTSDILVVNALHGLAGVGKSSLAAALAHTPEIRNYFQDGVLWATLGQQPDILSLLNGWIQALHDHSFKPTSVEVASVHLRTLLQDKSVLLVVDDVWASDHARPFLVGGSRCRVLLTTREALVARAVDATIYTLGVMTSDQALDLLERYLDRSLKDSERGSALALTQAVGNLPLALALVAAQVADGISWNELLTDLQTEVARLESLSVPGIEDVTDEMSRKRLSLLASFNLSLARLSLDHREQFAWLGVLPEDVSLNASMAMTLWNTDQRTARDNLRYLRDKALVLPSVALSDGSPTYRVHDLLHDLSRRLLTLPQPAGLGRTLPQAHSDLLDRYRVQTRGNLWSTLSDDGYIHQHLTWHMEKAGQANMIYALLNEEMSNGRNAWYATLEQLWLTAAFLADVSRAWRLAEDITLVTDTSSESQKSIELSKELISLQCRYALIIASLNSLAKGIPPEAISELVRRGIWSAVQGLAYARQTPNPDQRAQALSEVALHFPDMEGEAILDEALATAREIKAPGKKALRLGSLISVLAPSLRNKVLQEAVSAARVLPTTRYPGRDSCIEVLLKLARQLPEKMRADVLQEAVRIAEAIAEPRGQVAALVAIAERLDESDKLRVLQHAVTIFLEVLDEHSRDGLFGDLIPLLSDSLLTELLRPEPDGVGMVVYGPVAVRLARMGRVEEGLAMAQALPHEHSQVDALVQISLCLHEEMKSQVIEHALEIARGIDDNYFRASALGIVAPYLSDGDLQGIVLQEALMAARDVDSEDDEAYLFSDLAPHLTMEVIRTAVTQASAMRQEHARGHALAALIPNLAHLGDVEQTLELASTLTYPDLRAKVLVQLLDSLPNHLIDRWLKVLRTIGDSDTQAVALVKFVPSVSVELRQEILEKVRAVRYGPHRGVELAKLAPHLPKSVQSSVFQDALASARTVADLWPEHDITRIFTAEAIVRLVPYLPEDFKDLALREAFDLVSQGQLEEEPEWRWWEIAAYLPEKLVRAAIEAARESSQFALGSALVGLGPRLAELGYAEDALILVEEIQSSGYRAQALSGLAPSLSEPQLRRALKLVPGLEMDNVWALVGLTARLAELGFAVEALSYVNDIESEQGQAEVLAALGPHLPYNLLLEVLTRSEAQLRDDNLQRVYGGVAPRLAELGYPTTALEIISRIEDVTSRAAALNATIPHLSHELIVGVLPLVWRIENEPAWDQIADRRQRAWVLSALASHLSHLPVSNLYPIWCETLHHLATLTREDLLEDIAALMPVITYLGGGVSADVVRTILEVTRWWP
ncbi:MAG: NB-ARC domain-containing protein [Anaerolineae bacterium]